MSQLTLFRIHDRNEFTVRAAHPERDWMDATNMQFAYRCLPLLMANQHGWELVTNRRIRAAWTGGNRKDDLMVLEGPAGLVNSHFGYGILTFSLNHLIRTSPGTQTFVGGPPNRPKRGVSALSGIVETDWSSATFTMNWKFTEPAFEVVFEPGEPVCFFFPVRVEETEATRIAVKPLSAEPATAAEYSDWSQSRNRFLARTDRAGSEWEKHYFQGRHASGEPAPVPHRTKLKLGDPAGE